MRRILIVGAFVAAGVLVARALLPKLQERLLARCEAMFERMPDTFPPKRMMRGIEEIRVSTGRTVQLLEIGTDEAAASGNPGSSTEAVHDAA
jgi:hypothetical protein